MKRGKHPTTKRRNRRQSVKVRYSKAREDAQLVGLIPTEPVGAVREERVLPSAQDDPTDHLGLVAVAARSGWATPDDVKPRVVDNLSKIATGEGGETLIGKDGEAINTGPSLKTQVYAAKVLTEIDQIQYERDNPENAGKAKGATNVNVGVGVSVFGSLEELLRRAREQRTGVRDGNENDRSGNFDGGSAGDEEPKAPGAAGRDDCRDRSVAT